VDSEVRSQIFSPTHQRISLHALAERYQASISAARSTSRPCARFTSTQTELVRILHTPAYSSPARSGNWATRPVTGRSRAPPKACSVAKFPQDRSCRWVFDRRSGGQIRSRADALDAFAMAGWSFRPALILRDTFYNRGVQCHIRQCDRQKLPDTIRIAMLEASIELVALLVGVSKHPWAGTKWRDASPASRYDYVTGVNNFADILRFDAADVLTNTNEVEYSIVNRIYSRHMDPNVKDCDPQNMSTLTIGGVPQVWCRALGTARAQHGHLRLGPARGFELGSRTEIFFDPTFGKRSGVRSAQTCLRPRGFHEASALVQLACRSAPVLRSIISRLRIETRSAPVPTPMERRTTTSETGQIQRVQDLDAGADYSLRRLHWRRRCFPARHRYGSRREFGPTALCTPDNKRQRLQVRPVPRARRLRPALTSAAASDAPPSFVSTRTSVVAVCHRANQLQLDCCGLSLEYRRFAWEPFGTRMNNRSPLRPGQHWRISATSEAERAV